MQTVDLKAFRRAYKLTQVGLAKLLDKSREAVAQIETGRTKITPELIQTLLEQDEYDVRPYIYEEGTTITATASGKSQASVNIGASDVASYQKEIESLKEQLKKCEAEKERYWEMIQKLIKQ